MKNIVTCPVIEIDGSPINRVNNFTFLGIIIDQKLTFHKHVAFVCSKVSKSVGIISKINYLPANVLKCLYYSIVYSYLIYCIESWGASYKTTLYPLLILQKRAIRIIANSEWRAHTAPLFKKLDILQLDKLYCYRTGICFYNIMYNHKADYILDELSNHQIVGNMRLRNHEKFRLPKV